MNRLTVGTQKKDEAHDSFPEWQGQMARDLLAGVPLSARPMILNTVKDIARLDQKDGERAMESLRLLIHEKGFRTDSAWLLPEISKAAGRRSADAFDELRRLADTGRCDRYAIDAIRSVASIAKTSLPEAISALSGLLSNPGMEKTPKFSLPTRFNSLVKTALANSWGWDGLALSALGSMLSNRSMRPEMMTTDLAIRFGRALRAACDQQEVPRQESLSLLGWMISNPDIKADQIGMEVGRRAFELTALSWREGGTGAERLSVLVRNQKISRSDILASGGLIENTLRGVLEEDRVLAIGILERIVKSGDRSTNLLDAARRITAREEFEPVFKIVLLNCLDAFPGNPKLSEKSNDPGFPDWFIRTAEAITSMQSAHALHSIKLVAKLLDSANAGPGLMEALDEIIQHGGNQKEALLTYLDSIASNAACEPSWLNRKIVDDLIRINDMVANQAKDGGEETRKIKIRNMISIPLIDPSMLSEGGAIDSIIKKTGSGCIEAMTHVNEYLEMRIRNGAMTLPRTRSQAVSVLEAFARLPGERLDAALKIYLELDGHPMVFGGYFDPLDPRIAADIDKLVWELGGRGKQDPAEAVAALLATISSANFSITNLRGAWPEESEAGTTPKAVGILNRIVSAIGKNARPQDIAWALGLLNASMEAPFGKSSMALTRENVEKTASLVALIRKELGADADKALDDFTKGVLAGSIDIERIMPGTGFLNLIRAFGKDTGAWKPMVVRCALHIAGNHDRELADILSDASKAGNWIAWRLSEAPASSLEDLIINMERFLSTAPAELIRFAMEEPELYQKGKALADRLIRPPRNDPMLYANMAYAIDEIGEEKTARLHAAYGIENFFRYSDDMLKTLVKNLDPANDRDKPLLLVAFNKNDWNGAFYTEGRRLDALRKHYRVIIREMDSEDGFYDAAKTVSANYGRIDTLIIGGHGSPDSIRMGENDEKGKLDLTDETELASLRSMFKPRPTVVLVSCSTGKDEKAIGGLMSRVWNARLFAPRDPANVSEYSFDSEGQLNVTYTTGGAIFSGGRTVGNTKEK